MAPPRSPHGTYASYCRGCTCASCRQAGRDKRAEIASDPVLLAGHREAQRKYRASERGQEAARTHRVTRVAALRERVIDAKSVPCMDCALTFPYYVMDFDHRPDEVKLFNIAEYARLKPSMAQLEAEIAKCDVICSNCHRIRTYERSA